jgi:hypothetical protein
LNCNSIPTRQKRKSGVFSAPIESTYLIYQTSKINTLSGGTVPLMTITKFSEVRERFWRKLSRKQIFADFSWENRILCSFSLSFRFCEKGYVWLMWPLNVENCSVYRTKVLGQKIKVKINVWQRYMGNTKERLMSSSHYHTSTYSWEELPIARDLAVQHQLFLSLDFLWRLFIALLLISQNLESPF